MLRLAALAFSSPLTSTLGPTKPVMGTRGMFDNALRNAALVLVVGGVALVLGVLYLVGRPPLRMEHVPGWLEEKYKAEADRLFAAAGERQAPSSCVFLGKSIAFSCKVSALKREPMARALRDSGWSKVQGSSSSFRFTREQDIRCGSAEVRTRQRTVSFLFAC